jgi:Protein of unknown function (DUF1822)
MNDLLAVDDNDFYSFDEEEILLTEEQIAEAVKISERVTDQELQWQVYLSSLALSGFTSWLDERDDELKIDTSLCPLFSGSPKIGAANRLQIGGFKVCVIAKGGLDGDYVNVPQAILKDSAETAQFYIFVEVLEEMSQAVMYGFLRSDRLDRYAQVEPLEDFSDGTCDLPVSWLNLEFDKLVSYLRCFNPSAIPLPKLVSTRSIAQSISSSLDSIENLVINTSQWFDRQLDRVSESLEARLLPMKLELSTMRSSNLSLAEILDEIQKLNPSIKILNSQPKVRYLIDNRFTLDVLVQKLPDNQNEWSMLSVLTPIDEQALPLQLSLQIDDDSNMLNQEIVEREMTPYLYTCVTGNFSESFKISIFTPDGNSTILPRFVLKSDTRNL